MQETVDKIIDTDPLCFEKFALDENAINTIATILGFTSTDLMNEENKENPDTAKIEELKKSLDVMYDERQEIYFGNDEVKHSVIKRYAPIIREKMKNE